MAITGRLVHHEWSAMTCGDLCCRDVSGVTWTSRQVFGRDGAADRYLDTSDENQCNWMCLVSPSSESQLQNLACLQVSQSRS